MAIDLNRLAPAPEVQAVIDDLDKKLLEELTIRDRNLDKLHAVSAVIVQLEGIQVVDETKTKEDRWHWDGFAPQFQYQCRYTPESGGILWSPQLPPSESM